MQPNGGGGDLPVVMKQHHAESSRPRSHSGRPQWGAVVSAVRWLPSLSRRLQLVREHTLVLPSSVKAYRSLAHCIFHAVPYSRAPLVGALSFQIMFRGAGMQCLTLTATRVVCARREA